MEAFAKIRLCSRTDGTRWCPEKVEKSPSNKETEGLISNSCVSFFRFVAISQSEHFGKTAVSSVQQMCYFRIDKTPFAVSPHMLHFSIKRLAFVVAAGAALIFGVVGAAMAEGAIEAPTDSTHGTAAGVSSRRIDMALPDALNRVSQMPGTEYQGKQTTNIAKNNEGKNGTARSTPALFPDRKTRPTTSLIIGWLPAKEDTNTSAQYQPEPYKFASTKRESGCQPSERTASDSGQTPDSGRQGLHVPAGWLLGMCLHY